jgi:flagellar biosynthesis protein FliR
MDFFNYLSIDIKYWPFITLTFLRIVTIFFFLPILGDSVVPTRLRILLAMGFTGLLWPQIQPTLTPQALAIIWDPFTLFIYTLKEIFLGFCMGFASKFLIYAVSYMAHLVGINMGFQAASFLNPTLHEQSSSFANFMNWVVVIVIISLNLHHSFLINIGKSFLNGSFSIFISASKESLALLFTKMAHESVLFGLKIAAPLLCIQVVLTLSLGLINRAMPQLNVLIINFPVSFLVSMVVLALSMGTLVLVMAGQGAQLELGWIETVGRLMFKN